MSTSLDIGGATPARRIALIDTARGVAIVAMVVYHFTWDLGLLRFIDFGILLSPGWVAFQKMIVGSFILLAGVSLALAHARGIRWKPFWRRFAILIGAAALVTIGTYLFEPQSFVYFGVLHAIAAFSLMGLVFLRTPLWLNVLLAAVLIATPLFFGHPLFGERLFSPIGLWDTPPPSEDLVPIFPWFAVTLLGISLARVAMARGWTERLAAVQLSFAPLRWLAVAGRWSLVIYLVHQPLMIGALTAVAQVTNVGEAARADDFIGSCEASCAQSAGNVSYCSRYCACALERVVTEDLWSLLEGEIRSSDEERALAELTNQCAARVIEQDLLMEPAQPQ